MKKEEIFNQIEELRETCEEISSFLWHHPEQSGTERVSSKYCQEILEQEGFHIWDQEAVPHAFCAEFGEGAPVIALLCEFDALPGLSQVVGAVKKEVTEGGPGHGCGHNLLGAGAITSAIAVKRYLEKEKVPGTIRLYGCPEEELLAGKVKMVYHHMFDHCDLALSWHPMSANMVYEEAYLASASARFYFDGVSSHAGFAPQNGRSALDAVELMSVGCNYLREHVIDRTRIHYTTDSGGYAPNIVPPHASAWYFVRAPHMADVKETLARIEKVAQGAAMMTETQVKIKVESGCCEMKKNTAFADLTYENMKEAGDIVLTEEEKEFASELSKTLNPEVLSKDQALYETTESVATDLKPRDFEKIVPLSASTDGGDVSYLMPMNLFTTSCFPVGVAPHTWQACAAAGSSMGAKGALHAAKIMAGIALDLFQKPEEIEQIKQEFNQHKESYAPMYFPVQECSTND